MKNLFKTCNTYEEAKLFIESQEGDFTVEVIDNKKQLVVMNTFTFFDGTTKLYINVLDGLLKTHTDCDSFESAKELALREVSQLSRGNF